MKIGELISRHSRRDWPRRRKNLCAASFILSILAALSAGCARDTRAGTGTGDVYAVASEQTQQYTVPVFISESARSLYPWAPAWLPPVAETYLDDIDREARAFDVSPVMMSIIITIESGWNRLAVSKSGAQGLGGIMPATGAALADKYGIATYDPYDHTQNIKLVAAYLAEVESGYGGVLPLRESITAYHDGPNSDISTPSEKALWYLQFAEPMYVDPQNPCNAGNTRHTHALIFSGGLNLRTAFEQQGMNFDTWAANFAAACPYTP